MAQKLIALSPRRYDALMCFRYLHEYTIRTKQQKSKLRQVGFCQISRPLAGCHTGVNFLYWWRNASNYLFFPKVFRLRLGDLGSLVLHPRDLLHPDREEVSLISSLCYIPQRTSNGVREKSFIFHEFVLFQISVFGLCIDESIPLQSSVIIVVFLSDDLTSSVVNSDIEVGIDAPSSPIRVP